MNTQSDNVSKSFASQKTEPAAQPAPRSFYWSLRRELWEYRSIYIAPLIAAGIVLFHYIIGAIFDSGKLRHLSSLDMAHQHQALVMPYNIAAGLIMAFAIIVAVIYSLEALHGERSDRSILFWKSLPVSDRTTVAAKAIIPIVLVPFLAFAIMVGTQLTMLPLTAVLAMRGGLTLATFWTQLSLSEMWVMLLYHLVTVHSLWHAPLYAWLMLVSGWARRAAFLWASLPLLAIIAIEKLLFGSSHFANILIYRLRGPELFQFQGMTSASMYAGMGIDPGRFFSTPGLWIGLAVAAIFIAVAVRMRRYQGPI
jgi:ABC-2 type transport system permease protein